MKRYVVGQDRSQSTLFPESLDEYIALDNPVRVVDVFVDELDLLDLGFEGAEPELTGRPAYHPATLLKIYIYGYLNRIQSSRRLERETQRNVELIWLTGRLMPDFKTIADFRKENGKAIRRVCREFVELCRNLNLFTEAVVAIDGSKFKAVNNRDQNLTAAKLKARVQHLEENIAHYLADLDRADQSPTSVSEARTEHLQHKVATIRAHLNELKQRGEQLAKSPDGQLSLTDPDARSMATTARGSGTVGYNVQVAVDAQHHLIVTHEVTNTGHDRTQLAAIGKQPQQALHVETLTALADRGYYKSEEILACEQAGITALVPKSQTSNNKAKGQFDRRDFRYISEVDEYQCPANQRAIWRMTTVEHGMTLHRYWTSACPRCPIKAQCTTADYRRITRWEHEEVLEAAQARLEQMPHASRIRRQTVEHVFGTLKSWMGATHFLTKRFNNVSTEMSLHVLAYNLKRAMQIVGIRPLMQAMRA
jgi:transposase